MVVVRTRSRFEGVFRIAGGLAAALIVLMPTAIVSAPSPRQIASARSEAPGHRTASGADLEARFFELRLAAEGRMKDGAWDEAIAIVGKMAALDADHPKVYLQAVQIQNARGKLDEAPALFDRLGRKSGPGRSFGEGLVLAFKGRARDGRPHFLEALEGYTALRHLAGQAACHNALGLIAKGGGDLDGAAREYALARDLLERAGDRQGLADVLKNLADVELARGNPGLALDAHRVALGVRREMGDRRGEAMSLQAIGIVLGSTGDAPGALATFREALAIRRETGQWEGQIATLREMAAVHARAAEWDAALAHLDQALAVASAVPDAREQARVNLAIAETLDSAGRTREALGPLESAASLFRQAGDKGPEARALARLGEACNQLGEYRRSRTALQTSLIRAREASDRSAEAFALTGLGNLAIATGDLSGALVDQREALELHRRVSDRAGELSNLNNIGATYLMLGDRARARVYVERALRAAVTLEDLTAEAQARSNLGVLLAEEGRADAGLGEIQTAISLWNRLDDARRSALARANAAEILIELGRRQDASRDLDAALASFRAAKDLEGEAYASNLLGELKLAERDVAGAIRAHTLALELARDADLPDERWRAHEGLARALDTRGRKSEATKHLNAAMDEIEEVRTGLVTGELRMRFLAGRMQLYERALSRMLPAGPSSGPPSAALVGDSFRIVERARARSLLDRLGEPLSPIRRTLPAELRRLEEDSLDELGSALARLASARTAEERAAARRGVDLARERRERVEIEVQTGSPRAGGVLRRAPASLDEVRARILREGELLLEYFVGEDHAWVWTADRKGASVEPLPHPDRIASLVAAFDKTIEDSATDMTDRHREREAAEALAAALLPGRPLPRGSRLIVVPDGPLHGIPFEALRRAGRFLVEDHEIFVVPSAAILGLQRSSPAVAAKGGFLGIADPDPPKVDAARGSAGNLEAATLPPLPFARREVEAIAQLFPEPERRVLMGEDATKQALRALDLARFRFIHFSTHGWLDAENPADIGLRLANQGGEGTAILFADEVVVLPLASESVVLSACGSGLGARVGGEGPVGLARAFLYAGSRTVVVSLWDIGDRSTTDLMTEFYRGLRKGHDSAAALRRAKLTLLESRIPGRDRILEWAPFVLVGDPAPPSPADSNRRLTGATH